MRMTMMEIRRMLVTVAASFMDMHMGMPAFYRIVMMMRMVFIIMQISMVVSDRFMISHTPKVIRIVAMRKDQ